MRLRVRSLALLSGLRIRRCRELCGVGCRRSLDPTLMWLWHRPMAPIRPLAWESPYAARVAQEMAKKKTKKKKFSKPVINRCAVIQALSLIEHRGSRFSIILKGPRIFRMVMSIDFYLESPTALAPNWQENQPVFWSSEGWLLSKLWKP